MNETTATATTLSAQRLDVVTPAKGYRGSLLTGLAGAAAGLGAAVLLRDWAEAHWMKTLAALGVGAVVMVLTDLVVYRSHQNPTTGLAPLPVRSLYVARVAHKLVGLWLSKGTLAFAYWLLAVYADPFYDSFKAAALWLLPGLVVASPFYIAYVDRRQVKPVDAYAQLGMLLGGTRPENWNDILFHTRAWLVKGFFLPLMFAFCNDGLVLFWDRPVPNWNDFQAIYAYAFDGLYLFDVYLAAIAYAMTFRLLDSHLRSAEPTLGGWVVCLICYQPFVNGVGASYLKYDADDVYWGNIFSAWPTLYVMWGSVILLLITIYVLSTASFGLRFSNLTNRGIISTGPYRWVKHPAYISKNLTWWMISVPFIAGAGWATAIQSCLLLLVANLIYFLRAKTEERHLSADPDYRAYAAFIAEHGLVAVLRRLFYGRRTADQAH